MIISPAGFDFIQLKSIERECDILNKLKLHLKQETKVSWGYKKGRGY